MGRGGFILGEGEEGRLRMHFQRFIQNQLTNIAPQMALQIWYTHIGAHTKCLYASPPPPHPIVPVGQCGRQTTLARSSGSIDQSGLPWGKREARPLP